MLTKDDDKYWWPVREVGDFLFRIIPRGSSVLDVGPGSFPFPLATAAVDLQGPSAFPTSASKWPGNWYKCDLTSEPLPFKDKSFDFVYCRQVLEDMWNPFLLLQEMQRVGKAGYIECPSPVAELCRGVDGGEPKYRGFIHHHWIIWVEGETLKFIPKWPLLETEHMKINDGPLGDMLKKGPQYWNSNLLWKDRISFGLLKNGIDYILQDNYDKILIEGVIQSFKSADRFWAQLKKVSDV